MHLAPSYGKPAPWGAIVDKLYAHGEDGRIPVVAVTGTNGKTTTARLIAHLFTAQGLRVGMTNTDGVYVERPPDRQRRLQRPQERAQRAAHPDVDAAVFETARAASCARAWASTAARWPWSPTSARRPPGPELHHHGRRPGGAQARDRAERGADRLRRCSTPADPIAGDGLGPCPGKVILSRRPPPPGDGTHRAQGHRTGVRRRRRHRGGRRLVARAIHLRDVPITRNGKIGFQVENMARRGGCRLGRGLH